MKAYIVQGAVDRSEDGTRPETVTTFCTSQSECASARKELTDQGTKRKDIETFELEIPTTKTELIQFLNLLVTVGAKAAAADYKLTKPAA